MWVYANLRKPQTQWIPVSLAHFRYSFTVISILLVEPVSTSWYFCQTQNRIYLHFVVAILNKNLTRYF